MKKGKYLSSSSPSGSGIAILVMVLLVLIGLVLYGAWKLLPDRTPEPAETEPQTETTEPTTEPAPTETTPTEPVDPTRQQAQAILDTMTLDEKIYQLFIVTPEQLTGVGLVTQSGETTRQAIQTYPVGGVIYFAPNLENREQCKAMLTNIQAYSKLGLFLAVDEEGGLVDRVGGNPQMGTTEFPAMMTIGDSGDTEQAYHVGATIGADIGKLGFNLDFAPVADVFSNPNNTVIGSRAFSKDAQKAADMVAACVEGFRESGMLCTLKHFPGHGDTGTDSHYGAAETEKTLEQLRACEFLPFQAGIDAGAQFVMMGHITAPNVTEEDVPATLSQEIVTGLLRQELGFEGIIITDSMVMHAITNHYSSGEAAVKALQAGVDIILMPSSLSGAVSGIQEALENGQLTEARINESVLRILETKIRSGIIQVQ